MFRNRSVLPIHLQEVEPVPSGEGVKDTYAIKLDENGHKIVYVNGQKDVYSMIQESKESCDINNIVAKAQYDPSVLNARNAEYGDFTQTPKTMAEAMNLIIEGTREFDKLPIEIRQAYNFSPEQYIADIGSEHHAKVMGFTEEEINKSTSDTPITE